MPNNRNKFCDAKLQQGIELQPSDMHVTVITHLLVDEALPVIAHLLVDEALPVITHLLVHEALPVMTHLLVDEAPLVALTLGEEGAPFLLQLLGGLGQAHPHNGVTGDQGLQLVLSPPLCSLRPQWNGQEPASQPGCGITADPEGGREIQRGGGRSLRSQTCARGHRPGLKLDTKAEGGGGGWRGRRHHSMQQ